MLIRGVVVAMLIYVAIGCALLAATAPNGGVFAGAALCCAGLIYVVCGGDDVDAD